MNDQHSLPIRTKSQYLGDLGEVETARMFLRWGWTAEPIDSDYGEDLDCNIFIDSQRTNLHFRCQVKSTFQGKGQVRLLKNGDYSVSISTSTLKIWLRSFFPVILTVYDDSNGNIYWLNATEEISEILNRLSQKTVTLRVSKKQELTHGKEAIMESIVEHYSDILRLSKTKLTCNIIPVLMPGYLGCSYWHWHDWLEEEFNAGEIHAAPGNLSQESLPAWAMSIKPLEPISGLLGLEVTLNTNNLEVFFDTVAGCLPTSQPPGENNDWVAYIFSPLKLIDGTENIHHNDSFWSRELTGWMSYVCVNNEIVSEKDYIFSAPDRFLSPIGKAAGLGWGLYPLVSRDLDMALQFFASVEVTLAYKQERKARRQIYESQYLPWTCPFEELQQLIDMLREISLGFMIIEELSTERFKVGIICTPLFDPQMQLFTTPHKWSERLGGIRYLLGGQIDVLPGKEEHLNVTEFLTRLAGHILKNNHVEYLTMDHDSFIPGLPTDLTKRIIEVTRYRAVSEDFDETKGSKILQDLISKINITFPQYQNLSANIDVFEEIGLICRIEVSWQPAINESSSYSFNQISTLIWQAFNQILPNQNTLNNSEMSDTYNVFRLNGAVVFEDDPDYFKRYFSKE